MKNDKQYNEDDSWVALPRSLASDRRNGNLTLPEYHVLVWLFNNANIYGICTISLEDVVLDVFDGRINRNWINKIFLSLKGKRYIWYTNRAGRRGSFEVRLDKFLRKDKTIFNVDNFLNQKIIRSEEKPKDATQSEEKTQVDILNQRLKEQKKELFQGFMPEYKVGAGRGDKNNKEKEKENNINTAGKKIYDAIPDDSPIKKQLEDKTS